jgi:two-component system, LuxR family, sensor kinase FixL
MKNVKVVWKLFTILLLGTVGVIAVGTFGLFTLRDSLLQERRSMARQQVELGHGVLTEIGNRVASGELSREDAKKLAAETIRVIGYGRPEYFWIINHEPRMIMHPYLPALEGMHIDEIADPAITRVFSAIVASAPVNGSGYASYLWLKPGEDELVEKISYVSTYEPWDWILGAGVYVDDVQARFEQMAWIMGAVAAAVIGLVLFASVMLSRSITGPLTEVATGLRQLSDGDLDIPVPTVDRRDELGDVIRAMGLFRESLQERERLVRDLEEGNRVLRESEARFRDLAELLPETVFETDTNGRLIYANRAAFRTFGWPDGKFREGILVYDLFDETDRDRAQRNAKRIMAGDIMGANEYMVRRDGGELFSVLIRSVPILRDGSAVGLRGMMVDVSERIAAAERETELRNEIAHVSRLSTMGEMAAGFAHELNQPLAAITNFARGCVLRLESDDKLSEQLRFALDKIGDEAMRAGDIIRRIRDFVRKRKPERVLFDIDDTISDVVGLLGAEIRQSEVDVLVSAGTDLPPVLGDPVSVRQVLLNLIRNAVEVLGDWDGGERRIVVKAERDNHRSVQISVVDSGPGIPDDLRRQVFEPFYTTKETGTGMGLSICRTIVEGHGGRLEVEVPAEGGTCFTFRLPVDADSEKDAA